jgi:O-antigen/teichoic acid export membrane protein
VEKPAAFCEKGQSVTRQKKVIAKNFLVMMTAAPLGAAVNFVMTMSIARFLKSDGFGFYSQIISYISIFQILIEGSRPVIIKKITADPARLTDTVATTKSLLWSLSGICFGVMLVVMQLTPGLQDLRLPVFFVSCFGALALFHALGYGIMFIAAEKMELNALGSVSHKLLAFGLVMAVLLLDPTLTGVLAAIGGANYALWGFYVWLYRRHFPPFRLSFDSVRMGALFREIVVTGATVILRRISWNADIIILSILSSAVSVGIFNGAYLVIQSLNMIPWIGTLAFYPHFARMASEPESRRQFLKTISKGLLVFYGLVLPMIAMVSLFVDDLVVRILGTSFDATVPVMQVLIWDLACSLPISFLFYVLNVIGHEKVYLVLIGIGLGLNILLDLLLVPHFDAMGAAVGTLGADLFTIVSLLAFLFRRGMKSGRRKAATVYNPKSAGS